MLFYGKKNVVVLLNKHNLLIWKSLWSRWSVCWKWNITYRVMYSH